MIDVLVKKGKDNVLYRCMPLHDGRLKCGKCSRGVFRWATKDGALTSPVGKKCKVCGAEVIHLNIRFDQ